MNNFNEFLYFFRTNPSAIIFPSSSSYWKNKNKNKIADLNERIAAYDDVLMLMLRSLLLINSPDTSTDHCTPKAGKSKKKRGTPANEQSALSLSL